MKKFGLTLIFILSVFVLIAQDVVKIKHTNYTTHFSKSKKYPLMVEWITTKAMIGCPTPLKRKDNFKPDPQLVAESNIGADYVKSGYDRGHVMPAAENLCQTPAVQDECFYFTNMIPQLHRLNAGDWKSLETAERDWAFTNGEVKVWAGAVGESKKIGAISIPEKCWKVIYIKNTKQWLAFVFNNDLSTPNGYADNAVKKEEVEKLSGFKFIP
jgi:endonuclease G